MKHAPRSGSLLPLGSLLGFAAAIVAVLLMALLSYRADQVRTKSVERTNRAFAFLDQLESALSTLKDAETGQRGFLLTGAERYLEPYSSAGDALHGQLARLRELSSDAPARRSQLDQLEALSVEKMAELGKTIELRREGNAAEALALVRSDRGRLAMDQIRRLVAQLKHDEQRSVERRREEWERAVAASSLVVGGGSMLLLLLIPAAAFVTSRDFRARETTAWVRAGQAAVNASVQGGQRLAEVGESVLAALAQYLEAEVGAIYIADGRADFRRLASWGLPAAASPQALQLLRPGDGLLGQALKTQRVHHVKELPRDYLPIRSGLGGSDPRQLLIVPAAVDARVYAALELGFLRALSEADLQLCTRVSESIAIAVRTALDRARLEELLEETQRQAEELQTQQEELRVSNEELEEQSRALRDSQARLEAQQQDLETSNVQLEEQTQLLEGQKQRLIEVQKTLREKADELSRVNKYKSEFLANMSHELRTPLNSSLIMAQLLADNKPGNLNQEQINFARIISSANNDLLTLINDILDLSKIEAGKMELNLETLELARIVDSASSGFKALAQQKQIAFETSVDPELSERGQSQITTDLQRVQQILRNLLSNAFKFTERGQVALRVFALDSESIAFSVSDTGIGVSPLQQQLIFEAFRQADGTTQRRYGGTGLGLSISRDLARLLGGEISLESAEQRGSTFTLRLPRAPHPALHPPPSASQLRGIASGPADPLPESEPPEVARRKKSHELQPGSGIAPIPADDRQRLTEGARVLLIVEDDEAFAQVVADLAREQHFQCLIAHTADAGLELAQNYQPSAIVLDMVLPDHPGLSLLDRLKRNPDTRHIPVHAISAVDDARSALAMGAIGYAVKPVEREQLIDAFKKLEAKLAQKLRRVLVVERDAIQRDEIVQLLKGEGVEVLAVASPAEALQQLERATFDCLVSDLPDTAAPRYELLERMSREESYSFPPVIVYTARALTQEEEQQLGRYSRSIIIKGAKSPERLLDEVTLFLHQIESKLSVDRQRMLRKARDREAIFEKRSILVVEDDVRNVFALTSVFEPRGAKVEVARNGREALERLRSSSDQGHAFDLVLMDIMMPEMDGLSAMRAIRAMPEWKKLPIIALTAKAMPDDHEKCLAAGASDYIAKPLDVDKLLSLARVWISK